MAIGQVGSLACLAFASMTADAQSSVSVFGLVDVGLRYVKNGDASLKTVSTNGAKTTRLGFSAIEDLGGGLKAVAWLEHGFNPDTGTVSDATRFWNRRATVALGGGFGEVRLGRDFSPTYRNYDEYDAFNGNGVGAVDKFFSVLGSNADTSTRSDNLVAYFLPPGLGGVYGQAAVAPSEGTAGKRYTGGRLGYGRGPFDVSVAYGQTKVTPDAAGDRFYRVSEIGSFYDFGVVKVLGFYAHLKFGGAKFDVLNVGAHIPAGPGLLRVMYTRVDASGRPAGGASTDANDAQQFAAGYLYELSKRTALYANASRINNKGAATFAVGTPPPVPAGRASTGYEVGLRHFF
jgi:predicted porin